MSKPNPIETLANIRHEFGEHGGVNMSVEASTTFTVMEPETIPELFQGAKGPTRGGCYLYARHFNPTVYHLSRQIAALEGAEAAYCTASGMGAISAVILQLCQSGDHIVASNALYGGTYALLHDFLPAKANIKTTFVDITDPREIENAISDDTRLIYAESLSNPTLRLADMPCLAKLAHEHGAKLVIDNTFSPLMLSPIACGADVVVHSVTKFISGGSDIIAGAVCADEAMVLGLMDLQMGPLMLLGPTMDPNVAFALSLRIPHLALRMIEHGRRAQYFAEQLDCIGLNVTYPGLPSHPDHALAKRLHCAQYGFGGILALDVGSEQKANDLMSRLQNEQRFGYMAVSLGYFDTLMSCSGSSTSSELSEDDKETAGISPGLIRISVGYTGSMEQRWAQLEAGLRDVGLIS